MIYKNRYFIYDSETGGIIRACDCPRGKYSPCATKPDAHGYLKTSLKGREYKQHRLAWYLAYGRWPKEIDHINGIRHDNRLCNLREVSRSDNLRNMRLRSDNKTGCHGVYWNKVMEMWVAHIKPVGGREKYIGRFETKQEAIDARKEAEKAHGYHSNHGRG